MKETLSRLHTSLDLKDAVKDTDLVVEAIVENLDLKHKLFSTIDSVCTILLPSYKCVSVSTDQISLQAVCITD